MPSAPNRDLDLLFVIDDSTNLLETQGGFVNAFPAFLGELTALPGGLPNVHIGVVTSDLGALGALDSVPGPTIGSGPGMCSGSGKGGVLQTNGAAVTEAFISDIAAGDGTRVTNYSGSLFDTFKQMASVGSSGCGFEQHLAAARRALDNTVANAGFLRPGAGLAIFVLTDEDDCSFLHSSLLGPADDTLGPLSSFRCTRFGIVCDQGGRDSTEMATPGSKSGCHSNESSPYLVHLADYAAYFKGLKTDPRNVMMGVVSGDPIPFGVGLTSIGGGTLGPGLDNVCRALNAEAPSIRLPELVRMFSHGVTESVCTTDLGPAQASFARHLRNLVGDTCLPSAIAMPADCVVADQRADGTETILAPCDATGTCYELVPDTACTISGLRISVRRSAAPPADTMVSVRCMR